MFPRNQLGAGIDAAEHIGNLFPGGGLAPLSPAETEVLNPAQVGLTDETVGPVIPVGVLCLGHHLGVGGGVKIFVREEGARQNGAYRVPGDTVVGAEGAVLISVDVPRLDQLRHIGIEPVAGFYVAEGERFGGGGRLSGGVGSHAVQFAIP